MKILRMLMDYGKQCFQDILREKSAKEIKLIDGSGQYLEETNV